MYPARSMARSVVASEPAKMFLCYNRKDSREFAVRLTEDLSARGYITFSDIADISAGDEWTVRVGEMIAEADTLIFVLSPGAIASSICQWELQKAAELNKRVVPVVFHPVNSDALPPTLSRLNFIFFDNSDRYQQALDDLCGAIETDIGWIRQQTFLGQQTTLWRANDRSSDYLLRGAALNEAESWIQKRPKDTPEISSDILEFLKESRKREAFSTVSAGQGNTARPAPRPLGSKVFISYRRTDTSQLAGRIYDKLSAEFGEDQIFFDVDSIPIAVDFSDHIRNALTECAAIVVIIGRAWINPRWNQRAPWFQFWQPKEDFVETEITLALNLGVPIIPVLAEGAGMPGPKTLPAQIRELNTINGAPVRSGRDFHRDMSPVLEEIKRLRATVAARS
jgi:hypothetical protein